MDRIEKVLNFIARQIGKSDNHVEKWSQTEKLLMDLATLGECVVMCSRRISWSQEIDDFVARFKSLGIDGMIIRFLSPGNIKGIRFLVEEETGKSLEARFEDWLKRNAEAIAPLSHTRRLEWYRIDILQHFL